MTISTEKKTLRRIRLEAGLSVFELAKISETSVSTINRMEKGTPPVKLLTAGRVLRALGKHIGRTLMIDDVQGLQIITEEAEQDGEE